MENLRSDEAEVERRAGRRRWTRAKRVQVLREYRASGLTQEKFAGQAGIKVGTLRAWIYKAPTAGGDEPGGFAPVRIVDGSEPSPMTTRGAVTVRWPQGMEVEIAVDLDGAGVERLVRELLTPCLR
jgi:transposase-like protein